MKLYILCVLWNQWFTAFSLEWFSLHSTRKPITGNNQCCNKHVRKRYTEHATSSFVGNWERHYRDGSWPKLLMRALMGQIIGKNSYLETYNMIACDNYVWERARIEWWKNLKMELKINKDGVKISVGSLHFFCCIFVFLWVKSNALL